jgi:uncharacterized protein
LGGVQFKVLKIDFQTISLPQLAPGLAALVMLAILKKDKVKLTLAVKGAQWLNYIGAIGIPLLVSGVLFLAYGRFIAPLTIQPGSGTAWLIFLGAELIGAFGEELGWRGFLQRILEGRANVLLASLLVGLLWGFWHVLNYQRGPLFLAFFVLFTVSVSVIMARLLKNTDYNVVIAGLFHFAINTGAYIIKDGLADVRLMILNGIAWAVVAVVIVALDRKFFLSPFRKNIQA